MREFWATLTDGFKHAFDLKSIDSVLTYVLNILNDFGDLAERFFDILP